MGELSRLSACRVILAGAQGGSVGGTKHFGSYNRDTSWRGVASVVQCLGLGFKTEMMHQRSEN